jgi:hypothetical protein
LELYWSSHYLGYRAVGSSFWLGELKARTQGPKKFLNLESLKCHFLDSAAPPPVATALGYTRKCTEWQIRITTRRSCSIFFSSVYSCTIFFLSSNCLPDIFWGILPTHPHQKSNGPSLRHRKKNCPFLRFCFLYIFWIKCLPIFKMRVRNPVQDACQRSLITLCFMYNSV